MNPKLLTVFYCFVYAMINVAGSAIIKWHLKSVTLFGLQDWIKFLFSLPVMLAFVLIFLSALVMFKALSFGSLSYTVPIATGINFMITVLIGYFVFKDNFNWLSIVGYAFIIIGIIVLTINVQSGSSKL